MFIFIFVVNINNMVPIDKDKVKNFFNDLKFDEESHTYYVNGIPLESSVSGVIKKYVEQVDFTAIAESKDIQMNLPKGSTSRLWKLKSEYSCAKGNKAHFFGELYAFNRSIRPTDKYEEAIVKFWGDLPQYIKPFAVEFQMYHKKLFIGGMSDIILFNELTDTFIIADYKTNEDLHKNFAGKKLLAPFNELLDCNLNKYQIQFSLYQIMFEQTGYKVSNRVLIHLKPDGTYENYFTTDLTSLIKKELAW